jgi:hypothetical protein
MEISGLISPVDLSLLNEQFRQMVVMIHSTEALGSSLDNVERQLNLSGRELLRRFLQSYLELREIKEPKLDEVTGADGIVREHIKEDCQRDVASIFGDVEVKRLGYTKYGGQKLFPLDASLNLSTDKYSYGLRERMVEEIAEGSFDHGVEMVSKTTGGKVPKRQALELAIKSAQDFAAFYEDGRSDQPEQTEDPLIISLDGKGIVMREEALKEETRKAAEKERQKKTKARIASGEKSNRKRMATVATVYDVERHMRSAESIIGLEKPTEEKKVPKGRNKRVWASIAQDSSDVTEDVFQEALHRDPENKRSWVVVIDGGPQQLRNIQACIKKYDVKATLVLDFIHVTEYLWEAARGFGFKEGTAEAWVCERELKILHGKASDVAAGMRRSATLRRLSAKAREAIDCCANYLLKYAHMMKYDEYLKEGFPIASGAIEGACRYLIKDRMDITGARWGLQGAEAVLKLRSLKKSGDLDAYWGFHKAQELQRNHISHYKSPLVLLAA